MALPFFALQVLLNFIIARIFPFVKQKKLAIQGDI